MVNISISEVFIYISMFKVFVPSTIRTDFCYLASLTRCD